jgi:hypothetical protein
MRNHFYFRQHLCIVFDLFNISMYDYMEKTNFEGLPLDRIRRYANGLTTARTFKVALGSSVRVNYLGNQNFWCFAELFESF